jgi:hypothetical protein
MYVLTPSAQIHLPQRLHFGEKGLSSPNRLGDDQAGI